MTFFDGQADTLLQAVGNALLHSLWQDAGVAVLLAATLAMLRGRAAKVRYAVACFALMLMLFLPAVTAWQLSGSMQDVEVQEASVQPSATAELRANSEANKHADGKAVVADAEQKLVAGRQPSVEGVRYLLPWLTLIWIAGVSLLSARMLSGVIYARRLKGRGVRPAAGDWQERANELSRRLLVSQPVRILESTLVHVPTVIGWLRPVILLPASAFTGLTPQQLEAILAHELAHVRRHDYLVNVIQIAVETLLFYHPAVWWVSRQVRQEREHACDDWAVALTGDTLTYARALTQMERLRGRATSSLALAADGGSLRSRILRLVETPPRQRRASPLAALMFFAALLTGVACVRAVVLSEKQKDNTQPSRSAHSEMVVAGDTDAQLNTSSETPPPDLSYLLAGDNIEGEDAEVRRVAIAALGNHVGTVVVMDTRTGRIYAVVNQEWALRRGWTPASTMKLVTSLAGVGEKVIDPAERIRVSGRDERLDLTGALALSDNDYFRDISTRVGAERIIDYAHRLGLGEKTGINYEGEIPGRLPTSQAVTSAAQLGFGEGVEVTPVQLAVLVSAIGNGGKLLMPRVPRTPQEAAAFTGQPRRLDIAPAALAEIIPGMLAAVERGTASGIKDPTLKIAGKTGTVVDKRKGTGIGMFASYAPADDPRLTVVVLTSGEKESGAVSAQIAGSIYKALRGRI